VAIEALLAALNGPAADEAAAHRGAIGDAANAALRGEAAEHTAALEEAVAAMERALKRRRLGA
jgi:hypothetical protein